MTRPCILLVDNGSLKPEATLQLRTLANALTESSEHTVHPVSLLHSDKIPASDLQGRKADTVVPFIKESYARGVTHFLILPLFFGPSNAITSYLPQCVSKLKTELSELRVDIADTLVDCSNKEDTLAADALAEEVEQLICQHSLNTPTVLLVDHGSPAPSVTDVRNHIATQLEQRLKDSPTSSVIACSMERRPGEQYDFNEPLLETALKVATKDQQENDLIIALLFFFPGRHAGPDGDISQICEQEIGTTSRLYQTTPLALHSNILNILSNRLQTALLHLDSAQ